MSSAREIGSTIDSTKTVAIVVPLLNEIKALPTFLVALSRLQARELIFVDGGSCDGSYEWLAANVPEHACVLQSQPGRALQMNAGASKASADMLCFIHADSVLNEAFTRNFIDEVKKGAWGRFDVVFHDNTAPRRRMLDVVQAMINWRSRVSGIATGDQAMFVERELFNSIGGFEALPIMEDVALSKKLKQIAQPYCSKSTIGTSARRWQQAGLCRTILLMWFMRVCFAIGVSAEKLRTLYQNVR